MPVVGVAWMAELAPRHVARRAAAAAARPARRLCRPRAAVAVTGTTSAAICRRAGECTVSAGGLQRRQKFIAPSASVGSQLSDIYRYNAQPAKQQLG